MTNVFFKPYVGKEYHNGYSGKKVLILGESQCCRSTKCGFNGECQQLPECRDFTVSVVDAFLEHGREFGFSNSSMQPFTRFTKAFIGGKSDVEEWFKFWDCVMFYNYLQKAMEREYSLKAPEKHYFDSSQTAFWEVLEEYQPDLIFVWGARLEENLPAKNITMSDFEILNTPGHRLHYYEVAGKKITVYAVKHHPSHSGCNKYHEQLREAFRLA
jgi:hypothetical protein